MSHSVYNLPGKDITTIYPTAPATHEPNHNASVNLKVTGASKCDAQIVIQNPSPQ
jgi:hypothetical protein